MEDYFPSSLETQEHIGAGFCNLISPSPRPRRASRADDDAGVLHHHYLDACFLCGRLLGGNKDIFMYRGDTPFCSEECRQQQIETDEAREKRSKRSPASKEQRQRQEQQPAEDPRLGSVDASIVSIDGVPRNYGIDRRNNCAWIGL